MRGHLGHLTLFAGLLLLAGCGDTPVPFRIDHAGTLSTDAYARFDQQAAAAPSRFSASKGDSVANPEPRWVYTFDAPFDPHAAPLQIGTFTGLGKTASRVAANLPEHLRSALEGDGLFPAVTLSPTPHAYLLTGVVTRADDEDGPMLELDDAGTQVEAVVTRDGVRLGAIQVNALQINVGLPLDVSLIVAAAQGSRGTFVSGKFEEVFVSLAQGHREGIYTGGLSERFMRLRTTTVVGAPAPHA